MPEEKDKIKLKKCGRCLKKKINCNCGRPTVMTKEALSKLEGAFADGATDKLACFLAEVSEEAFYSYQNKNPEFKQRKEYLKDQVKFQAKKVIRDAIANGDLDTSRWYAERKLKDEGFSSRTELTGADGKDLLPTKEEKEKVEGLIDEIV